MSLDISASNLCKELSAGLANTKDLLGEYEEDRLGIAGPAYRFSCSNLVPDLENHAYEWLSYILPSLTEKDPQTTVRTPGFGMAEQRSQAQQFFLNRWAKITQMHKTNERLAVDYAFRWFVALTLGAKDATNWENDDPRRWPQLKRVSPCDFTWDPHAFEPESWRWSAHRVQRDVSDIEAEHGKDNSKGWNIEAVRRAKNAHKSTEHGALKANQTDRGQVEYWEVWVPEHQLEGYKQKHGFFGTWFTICENSPDAYLRKPRPYFGYREGPYTVVSGLVIPDEAIGAAPLVVTKQSAEELNAMVRALSESFKNYKNLLLTTDQRLAQTIMEGNHQWVYQVDMEDLRTAVASISVGGGDQHMLAAIEILRERRDRIASMSDAQRGTVTGVGTATEQMQAAQAIQTRQSYMSGKFARGLAAIMRKIAFYAEFDDSVKMRLGNESSLVLKDANGVPVLAPVWEGGEPQEGEVAAFEEAEYEIDVNCLTSSGEAIMAQRREELAFLGMTASQAMLQFPHVNWREWARQWDANSQLKAAERMFDFAMAHQLAGQNALAPPTANPSPSPRLPIHSQANGPRIVQGSPGRATKPIQAASQSLAREPSQGQVINQQTKRPR